MTHGTSFLPQADLILVLVEGEITENGSYQELLNRNGAFAEFIHTFASSERKECSTQRGTSNTFNMSRILSFFNVLSKNTLLCLNSRVALILILVLSSSKIVLMHPYWTVFLTPSQIVQLLILMSNENLCFYFRLQKVLLKAQRNRFHAVLQGPLSGATYWVSIRKEIVVQGHPILSPKGYRFFIPTKQVPHLIVN